MLILSVSVQITLHHFILHFIPVFITKARARSYVHPSRTRLFPKLTAAHAERGKIQDKISSSVPRKRKAWQRDYQGWQEGSKEAAVSCVLAVG